MISLGVQSLNMPIKKLPFKGYVYLAVIVNFICLAIVAATHSNLPPVVPLFYGLPIGSSQLISSWGLTIAPLSALLISAINILIASYLKDAFLKKMLAVASFFVSFLAIITVVKIILLVRFW